MRKGDFLPAVTTTNLTSYIQTVLSSYHPQHSALYLYVHCTLTHKLNYFLHIPHQTRREKKDTVRMMKKNPHRQPGPLHASSSPMWLNPLNSSNLEQLVLKQLNDIKSIKKINIKIHGHHHCTKLHLSSVNFGHFEQLHWR